MATIKLSRAQSANAAISYAQGKNKLQATDKQWLLEQGIDPKIVTALHDRAVISGGNLVDPDTAKLQMSKVRQNFHNSGKTQAMRVIQSFSDQDLNATDPHDWQTANDLGVKLAQAMAPNFQAAVYTHLDGDGHKLHNHIIINMPNLLTGKKYHHTNDFDRVATLNDQICQTAGLSIIDRTQPARTQLRTLAERKRAQSGHYVWKDDLRDQIDAALKRTADFTAFTKRLNAAGIQAQLRGQTIAYAFIDREHKHRRARGTRLGTNYDRPGVLQRLNQLTTINEADAKQMVSQLVYQTVITERPTSLVELQQQLQPHQIKLHLPQLATEQPFTYQYTNQQNQTFTFTPTELGGSDYELSTLRSAIRTNAHQLAAAISQAQTTDSPAGLDQSTIAHLINVRSTELRRQTSLDRDTAEVSRQLRTRIQATRPRLSASAQRFRAALPTAEFKTFLTHVPTTTRWLTNLAKPTMRFHSPLLSQIYTLLSVQAQQQAEVERERQRLQREQERNQGRSL